MFCTEEAFRCPSLQILREHGNLQAFVTLFEGGFEGAGQGEVDLGPTPKLRDCSD